MQARRNDDAALSSDEVMDRQPAPSKRGKGVNRALGILGAATVVTATGAVVHELDDGGAQDAHQKRVEILKQQHQLLGRIVTLEKGTNLRSTPEHQDGTPDDGLPNNVEEKTRERLTVNAPALVEGQDGNTYLMFTKPGEKTSSDVNAEADEVVFADLTNLYREGQVVSPSDLSPEAAKESATSTIFYDGASVHIGGGDPANTTNPMTSFVVESPDRS